MWWHHTAYRNVTVAKPYQVLTPQKQAASVAECGRLLVLSGVWPAPGTAWSSGFDGSEGLRGTTFLSFSSMRCFFTLWVHPFCLKRQIICFYPNSLGSVPAMAKFFSNLSHRLALTRLLHLFGVIPDTSKFFLRYFCTHTLRSTTKPPLPPAES